MTWEYYSWFRNQTSLPVVLKGIQLVEDAVIAYNMGAPAIYLSNHGGRQLDTLPSALELAVEICELAPYIHQGTMEVWADGGVRYGADLVKLLALGIKSVGVGRPFMFSNVYGEADVDRAVDILKREVAIDAANPGIGDLKQVNSSYIRWSGGITNQWGM